MKTNLLFTFLLLFFLSSFILNGQRLRDDPIHIKYVNLPKKKLPKDHKTYSVTVNGSLFGYQSGGSSESFAKSIKMDGFKKVPGSGVNGGHLRLNAYGGNLYLGQSTAKSRSTKIKNKDGSYSTIYYYFYEVPARCNTNYKIYNPKGEVLHSGEWANDVILKTKEYNSSKARSSARARDLERVKSSHASTAISSLRGGINSGLVTMYDYDNKDEKFNLYVIKKHASEEQWVKHYEKVKAIYKDAPANINSADLKEKLAPSIEFYEGHGSKNPKGDKKLKRIYKAANYNLALLTYSIDEFDLARAYADKVIASEKKSRRTRLLTEKMDKWDKNMKSIGVTTIHFKRDLTDARPPAEIAALEAEIDEMEEKNTTTDGSVFKGNLEIKGTWSLDKDADDLIFGEGGNIKFMIQENGDISELDLTNPDISKFEVADRIFKRTRFAPSAKGETEASMEILEDIYSSDRIKLFKFYPSTGGLSDDKPEFAFQKSGQEHPISLESTMFLLWKKGVAKYFADCPDLAEMATEGGVEKTKDSLIKAARVYSELCEGVIKP